MPPQAELTALFEYNNGDLIYRTCRGRQPAGSIAGSPRKDNGYIQISVGKSMFFAHRLVYQYHYGNLKSTDFIDHIDRNPKNNRIENLRVVSQTQNNYNTKIDARQTSGYKGLNKRPNGRYSARINHNGQCYYLGTFDLPEQAAQAYESKQRELWGQS